MSIHALHDAHGRTVRYLRLSLTDRCNLRCLYCHSNARHQCIPHEKVLRYEEMIRLVQIVRGMGVGKVRLTGGEPFARKGCDDFLLRLRQRFDDLDIRITTNGTLLEEHIPLLQRIRISAVNLSLDSFDRETFARVTGRDMLPEVLRALDAMLAAMADSIESYAKEALLYQAVAAAMDLAPTQEQIDTYSAYTDTYGANYCTMIALMDTVTDALTTGAQVK